MIYLLYSETVQKTKGLPEIGCSMRSIDGIRFDLKGFADQIFHFDNHKTIYWKNREEPPPYGYQYSDEERLIIRLKAVTL